MARLSDHRVKIKYRSLPLGMRLEVEQFADDYIKPVPIDENGMIDIENFMQYYSTYKNMTVTDIMDIVGCIDTKDYE